jgi:hypothetical protein
MWNFLNSCDKQEASHGSSSPAATGVQKDGPFLLALARFFFPDFG